MEMKKDEIILNSLTIKETDGNGKATYRFENVDEILQEIGSNGPFQWLLIAALLLMHVPDYTVVRLFPVIHLFLGAIANWITYFIATDIQWKCVENSTSCTVNGTLSTINNGFCDLNQTEWMFTKQVESSLKSSFQLCCGNEWLVHLATSSLFIGWAVSSLFGSFLADKYGRKNVLFTFFTVFTAAGSISAFSQNIHMFIILRFIMGIAIPASFQIVFIMLGEFTTNKHRVMFMSILQSIRALWLVLFSLVAYFIQNWSYLVLATTLPFGLALLLVKFVPESIYWLTLRGQQKELMVVIKKMCYWNNLPAPRYGRLENFKGDSLKRSPQMTDLFRSSQLIFLSTRVMFGAFVIGMVYYGLGLAADDLSGALYRDFAIIRAIDIPSNLLGIYLGNRFGRRKTVSINVFVASLACILIGFVPPVGNIKVLRLIFGITGNFCINMAFNLFLVWTMELYGTDLRANAMGASNFMARMGGAVAPWIVKGLKHVDPNAPFFLEGSLGVLSALMMWSMAETKGTSMRKMSEVKKPDALLT